MARADDAQLPLYFESRMPISMVTLIASLLSLSNSVLIADAMVAGSASMRDKAALVSAFDIAMNRAAGTPLPVTSATAKPIWSSPIFIAS